MSRDTTTELACLLLLGISGFLAMVFHLWNAELLQAAWASWQWVTTWTLLKALGWSAAVLTMWGAWLLSEPANPVHRGFALFLGANGLWIAFAVLGDQQALLVQQIVLTGISLKGIWRGFAPAMAEPFNELFEEFES